MLALLLAAAFPPPAQVDRIVEAARVESRTPGIAIGLIDHGEVVYAQAYGQADAKGRPLKPDTVMYGASITKAVFAQYVMQLVDEGRVDLDAPIEKLLPKPLPAYAKYKDLEGDERWRKITPRMLLSHSSGFANFAFLEPDQKLRIHFEPGSRYAYSGEGINLLQFVLEIALEMDVGVELQRRVFGPLGMSRTSLTWGPDFAPNLSDGWNDKGEPLPHHKRGSARAAGSMDTTIADLSKWAAAVSAGWRLTPKSQAEMLTGRLPLAPPHQFPTLLEGPNAERDAAKEKAALVWITFEGPQGPGYYKGGHDDQTDNTLVCLRRQQRCVLILTNSGVGARAFPTLVKALLGETGLPWSWEYDPILPLKP